ncbi:unnamed protein product [Cyclocybe aegerita]|uniref:Uncharacterized protein n=1 Tax=Cyclocybe aegerita TaxID=1973307 RepID=A0A8S0XRH6_CYCAE|nr:unnamed protein product [Cyclocybe aegerita]
MSSQLFSRERRSWTAKEDQLLRDAVAREDPNNSNPSKWHAIAKHVPNRTNKDCRKRWFAKMASDVVKGGWSPDEDEKLVKGIERYGTRWSLVASVVQSRNSDQCAKRWTDTLNPAIDRTTWSSEADELLLRAVAEHGKVWTKIVKTYFPGRTGLSAKNRYNSITRFNSDLSRNARPRRKSSEGLHYHLSRKTESVSSSSSSASPASPSMSLPFLSTSAFQSPVDVKPHLYHIDSFSNWSSSSSITTDDMSSFRSSPMAFEYSPDSTSPSTPSPDGTYQPFDLNINHSLPHFSESSPVNFSGPHSPASNTQLYNNKHFRNHSHSHMSDTASQTYPPYSQFPLVHGSNDHADQFAIFEGHPSPLDAGPVIGVNWDVAIASAADSKAVNSGYKLPSPNSAFPYVF